MTLIATDRGASSDNVAATSVAIAPASNFRDPSMAVLVLAYDNSGSAGADPYASISDSVGNTWTSRQNVLHDPGAASAGEVLRIFTSQQNVRPLRTTDTITVSFGANSTTAKAWALFEVQSNVGAPLYLTGNVGTGATTGTPTITTTSITAGDLVIGGGSAQSGDTWAGDADTSSGTWSTHQHAAAGTGATGMSVTAQYKVTTGTATQTYNPTLTSATVVLGWIAITESITGANLQVVADPNYNGGPRMSGFFEDTDDDDRDFDYQYNSVSSLEVVAQLLTPPPAGNTDEEEQAASQTFDNLEAWPAEAWAPFDYEPFPSSAVHDAAVIASLAPPEARSNSAEGGSDGVGVTTGNSGGASGDAWSLVTTGANTITYTSANAIRGTLGYAIGSTAAAQVHLLWTMLRDQAELYHRFYFRLPSNPSATLRLIRFRDASTAQNWVFRITAAGAWGPQDSASTVLTGLATTFTAGQRYRLESHFVLDKPLGHLTIQLYDADTESLLEEQSWDADFGDAPTRDIAIGQGNASAAGTFYVDELAYSTTDWLGPVAQGDDTAELAAATSLPQPNLGYFPDSAWDVNQYLSPSTDDVAAQLVADASVTASDTLAVAITDSATVQAFQAEAELLGAQPVADNLDAWSPDAWAPFDYPSTERTTTGDVVAQLFPPAPAGPSDEEAQAAAQTFDNLEAWPDPTWDITPYTSASNDDADAQIVADVSRTAADTLAIALTDTASVQAFEGIEQLVAAQPTYPDITPYFDWAPFDYEPQAGAAQSSDVSYAFGDVARPASDTLAVAITDTASVQVFEDISQVIAAQPTGGENLDAWPDPAWSVNDYLSPSTADVTVVFADVTRTGSDTLAVAITDTASVTVIEGVEQVIAAQPAQPDLAAQYDWAPYWFEALDPAASLDVSWLFTIEPKAATDTLAVAITDTASVQAFQGDNELAVIAQPVGGEHVAALFEWDVYDYAALDPTASVDATVAAANPPTFGAPTAGEVAAITQLPDQLEAWPDPTWSVTDYLTPSTDEVAAQVVATASVTAADTLAVQITDTATVTVVEGIEQVLAAQPTYGNEPGIVEALYPEALDIGDYSNATTLDVTWLFATRNIPATDTLAIALTDTASVEAFSRIDELTAANHPTGAEQVAAIFDWAPHWHEAIAGSVASADIGWFGSFIVTPPTVVPAVTDLDALRGTETALSALRGTETGLSATRGVTVTFDAVRGTGATLDALRDDDTELP